MSGFKIWLLLPMCAVCRPKLFKKLCFSAVLWGGSSRTVSAAASRCEDGVLERLVNFCDAVWISEPCRHSSRLLQLALVKLPVQLLGRLSALLNKWLMTPKHVQFTQFDVKLDAKWGLSVGNKLGQSSWAKLLGWFIGYRNIEIRVGERQSI